ncbi:MAG: gamma-glutamylcyclotransferase [Candidatus Brocadiaceae bacterium]|jgi:gamma-glutamylcyclotransferase (GGCT)/AIG2-like uncharacterized protein YtfP
MLYFAYGSNMDLEQIRERCPSAGFQFRAKLPDHELGFTRKSRRRGCGVADAVPTDGGEVWGVVYEIDEEHVPCLDRWEGYGPYRAECRNAYVRKKCTVLKEGEPARRLEVFTYFANRQPDPPPPSESYMQLITEAAKCWGLPHDYVRQLEETPVQER